MSGIAPGSPRFVKLEQLFHEALALPPAARAAFAAAASGDDPELAAALGEMLACEQRDDTGLKSSIGDVAQTIAVPADRSGERIGPYVLTARIRYGGMAEVYAAERADGQFAQQVAIKIARADRPLAGMAALFQVERELLARLRHPHICQFFDGGSTPSGEPYFVMERLDGIALNKACLAGPLPWRTVTQHLLDLCSAVAHIHSQLIVHRDIKPDNVLIAEGPTGSVVKLLDFGIASALKEDSQLSNTPEQTWYSQRYAAPEVVSGQAASIAADVYSLGRILDDLVSVFPASRHEEVQLIADKASAPQPQDRYASAQALSDDLVRMRDREPLSIKPRHAFYVAWRFTQRHALALSVGAVLSCVLLFALVREITLRQTAQAATVLALEERDKAEAMRDFLLQAYEAASPETNQGRDLPVSELLDQQVQALQQADSKLAPTLRADLLATLAVTLMNLGQFERAEAALAKSATLIDELGEHGSVRWANMLLARAQNAQRRDQFEQADAWFREVDRATGWRQAGAEAFNVEATLYSSWAVLAQRERRLDEAETMIQLALAARRQYAALQGSEPNTAVLLVTLGAIQSARGDVTGAMTTFQTAYRENQTYHRVDTFEHLGLLGWLGISLDRLGDADQAEPYLREAIAVAERLFKEPHPKLSGAYGNLGTMYLVNGRYAEAAPLLKRGLEVMQQLGDHRSAVYQSRINNLARLALEREDFDAAAPLLAEVLALRRQTFGQDSDRAIQALLAEARLALLQDDPKRALGKVIEAEASADRLDATLATPLRPDLLLTQAETEAANGQLDAARAQLKAFDEADNLTKLGTDRDRALWQFQRGRILLALKEPALADAALLAALDGFGKQPNCSHPICAQIQIRLAEIASNDGRVAAAKEHIRIALPVLQANMAPGSPSLKRAERLAAQP